MLKVYHLNSERIDAELAARHSRTSGTLEQRMDRLQRFLDFEDQKKRHNEFVRQKQEAKAADALLELRQEAKAADALLELRQEAKAADALLELRQEAKAADALLELRQDAECVEYSIACLKQSFADLDESYAGVVAENLRLNQRINNLELRLAHVENRSDSPPPLVACLQESNPQWELDTAFLEH
jgi:flagellar biosynthesis chaperone FliJ